MITFTCQRMFFLLFICFSFTLSLKAQDYITLMNGETLKVEVQSLTGQYIIFKSWENKSGETKRLAKTDIDMVKKANGTTVFFNRIPQKAVDSEIAEVSTSGFREKSTKAPVTIQKLNRRSMEVLYPMNIYLFGGITVPQSAVSSFDRGYTFGAEYTNYYSNHLGFVGHFSGTYNKINYQEKQGSLNGDLGNTWLMGGVKMGTGTMLTPIRLYGQVMIGGNYMLPMNGLDNVESALNLAYSGGGGVVIKDLIHLGLRYNQTRQKVVTPNRSEVLSAGYLSLILGMQF